MLFLHYLITDMLAIFVIVLLFSFWFTLLVWPATWLADHNFPTWMPVVWSMSFLLISIAVMFALVQASLAK